MMLASWQVRWGTALVTVLTATTAPAVVGQVAISSRHILVPQRPPATRSPAPSVEVAHVHAGVTIASQVASTVLEVELRNRSSSRQEAEMVVPLPEGSVLRGFAFSGPTSEPTAKLLPRDEARRLYESIVARTRDPGLLEFLGHSAVKSSVFPVEPNGSLKVQITYEQVLVADGKRVDYILPRSESLEYHVPWTGRVRIKSGQPLAAVYSPSHELKSTRLSGGRVIDIQLFESTLRNPGSFRLSYLMEDQEVTASLLAYPDPRVGGGYFLLLAGVPKSDRATRKHLPRELTLVLDRSGSMAGQKLDQVKAAALQIIEGLNPDDRFNIITYNEVVDRFASSPQRKDEQALRDARKFIGGTLPRGGTNIHDALVEGLRPRPVAGALPVVLFLTDGLPTIGQTSEKAIRELASIGNPFHRRLMTFGVGVDVNSPLLENLAYQTGGAATFVLPDEDVELKIAGVMARLTEPALAAPVLRAVGRNGEAERGRMHDVLPSSIPDLYQDDQLVVLGRYVGDGPLHLELTGEAAGERKTFRFSFDVSRASTRNHFVPRLWASRQIGVLADAIRSSGADAQNAPNDPRVRELVDEIVRLSTDFGVLSEYTAFLAREGTDLSRSRELVNLAQRNFYDRAVQVRSGAASVNQDLNSIAQKAAMCLNPRNAYWNANLQLAEVSDVQQVCDKALFRRADRWVDADLIRESTSKEPDRVVTFGSREFFALADRLADQGRQGLLAMSGEILLRLDNQVVLITAADREE